MPMHICVGCGRLCLVSVAAGPHICPTATCLTEHWPPPPKENP